MAKKVYLITNLLSELWHSISTHGEQLAKMVLLNISHS